MCTHGVCAFHPQGKRWSHADFTESIAVALLAFATASKTILKTTLGKHSSDNNCNGKGLPLDYQPLNASPQHTGNNTGTRDVLLVLHLQATTVLYALM